MLEHLLLDLDGTLMDSSAGIYHSFCLACRDISVETPELAKFCTYIGPPIQVIAKRLYPHLNHNEIEHFRKIFREDYDRRSYQNAEWYPEVIENLDYLSAELGIKLTLVTNKPTKPAIKLIKNGGCHGIFSRIVGIDYLVENGAGQIFNSKAEALSYVLSTEELDISRSAYLGDTINDREACKKCGLLFIGALYGYHNWTSEERPYWHIERFKDIKVLLKSM